VDEGGVTVRLCHSDDHSCYHRWTVYGARPHTTMTGQRRTTTTFSGRLASDTKSERDATD
jgi:hypothetical protein